jgi:carbamoyl-phosphate synthase large subunit
MRDCNVLITSAGRRVSLVRLFQSALENLNINGIVYAVDMNSHAPALQVADKFFTLPSVNDASYIDQLLLACAEHKIRLVIPTIDTELNVLSLSKDRFESNGVKLMLCSNEVNQIFLDKNLTQIFFEKNEIPAPKLYDIEQAKSLNHYKYPLIIKPSKGNASIGVTKIHNCNELLFFLDYLESPIIQEFIEGNEYTIDVLVGLNGEIKCAVPRLRIEIRAGEVSKAITVNDSEIIGWAYKIAGSLKGMLGCITIQCIQMSSGEFRFIEVNPRFGGGFPLSAEAGADFPRWMLQMILGINQDDNMQKSWKDGIVMLRYDQGIFTNRNEVKL